MLIIFGIILLVFGPKKLPELARNLGSIFNVFKERMSKTQENIEYDVPTNPAENTPAEATGAEPVGSEPETEVAGVDTETELEVEAESSESS